MKNILKDLLAAEPGSATFRKAHERLLHALDYAEKCQAEIAAVKTVVALAKDGAAAVKAVASIVGAVTAIVEGANDNLFAEAGDTAVHESPEVEAFEVERAGDGTGC